MAIDLKKIRAKLDASKNKGGKVWKPKIDSETKARLLPTADGDPFKEMHFHYNVGKTSVLCPKRNFDEECPICEFASELWNTEEKENQNLAKKLFARQRFYSPIILRDEVDPTVKVWGYSQTVYQELLEKCLNPEYGDITDPETGTDFTIKYVKGESDFPNTKLDFSRQTSSLCGEMGEDKCADLLDNMPDFESLYERKTTEQVQQMLDAWMDSDDEVPKEIDTEKYGDKGSAAEKTSVADALEDLKPKKAKSK